MAWSISTENVYFHIAEVIDIIFRIKAFKGKLTAFIYLLANFFTDFLLKDIEILFCQVCNLTPVKALELLYVGAFHHLCCWAVVVVDWLSVTATVKFFTFCRPNCLLLVPMETPYTAARNHTVKHFACVGHRFPQYYTFFSFSWDGDRAAQCLDWIVWLVYLHHCIAKIGVIWFTLWQLFLRSPP